MESAKLLKPENTLEKKEIINQTKKERTPLNEHIKSFIKETSIDTNSIAETIIAAIVITYDVSIKAIKPTLENRNSKRSSQKNNLKNISITKGLEKKSDIELRNILKEVELLPKLKRDQLIDLISSNPLVLKRIALEERKASLMKKTNIELKSMLKGISNISKLRKKELVKKILSLESKI